jgi:hypothetical protein
VVDATGLRRCGSSLCRWYACYDACFAVKKGMSAVVVTSIEERREEVRTRGEESAGTNGDVRTTVTRGGDVATHRGGAAPTGRLTCPSVAIKSKLHLFLHVSMTRRAR